MADTALSTRVTLSGGGASGYGTVAVPTAGQISNAQVAIDAVLTVSGVSIDTLLTANVTVYLVPQSFFTANGWSAAGGTAWGYTPVKGKAFVSNGLSNVNQRYTILHEIFHTIDSSLGVMNGAKRATVGALMVPAPNQSVTGWWNAGYLSAPNECAADTFPRAYAGITGPLTGSSYTGGYYYSRHIEATNWAAYRTAVGGAGAPASTTLAAAVLAAATNIKVVSVTGLLAGAWIIIGGAESHQIQTVGTAGAGGTGLTLYVALTAGYANSSTVVETSAQSPVTEGSIDIVVSAPTANGATRSHTISGLVPGTSGTVKMRYFDGTAWGPYNDPVAVALPAVLGLPTSLTVTPGTLTPNFGASLVSSDPTDHITWYNIIVVQRVAGAFVTKWVHEEAGITGFARRVDIAYGGSALEWDQTYSWGIEFENQYGVRTGFSGYVTFTPTIDVGPIITYLGLALDISYKINTQTPSFVLTNRGGGNIDQAWLRVWDAAGTTLLWQSGLLSFTSAASRTVPIPANILPWGANVLIDGAVRATGDTAISVYSAKAQVHINAQPGAPLPLSVKLGLDQVVRYAENIWITTTATPTLIFPYRDTDRDLGYTDNPTLREIELFDAVTGLYLGASPYVIRAGITDEWTVPGGLIAAESVVKARARYDDSGTNEVQRITITGSPTGGTFTLTYAGQTTAALARNATAATVTAALGALSNIGAGNVICTGGPLPATAIDVTFTAALAGTNVAQMTANGAGLTGGTSPTVTITTETAGVSGVRSPFSAMLTVYRAAAPTLTAVSPADGSTLTDATPTFSGTYVSSGGRAMVSQSLVLTVGTNVIYSSGIVPATAPSLNVPRRVLLNTGETVSYVYTVYDIFGLYAVALGTVTTAFSAPAAITGLIVTPDPVADALYASWDVSADAAFEEYRVYIKRQNRQFQLVATITDPDNASVLIYSAPHNAETIVRVVQFNGWAESDPAEVSAVLGSTEGGTADMGDLGGVDYIAGYWLVRPERVLELRYNAKPGQGDTHTDLEVFAPPGRVDPETDIRDRVVLNWGTTGYDATISIFTQDRELIRTLRAWKQDGTLSILKTWYGAVRYVRLTATPDTDGQAGWIDGQISYIEVAPVPLEVFAAVT